ncbi:MAG TPA: chemotaxis response regulator protein-glutamate methylesterase [Rhizomicrobium sp.]|nr:chemotaxis response regulator protein-glutamate methylesterase [Rhizomicrobium sp.]
MTQVAATDIAPARTRVMVVDDSAVVRGFIVRILNSDPAIELVATCSNGQSAVHQVGRARPDVVILDIEMPVMDGLTALPRLLAADPETRVIMASTLTQKNAEISLEAMALGAADYIPKPIASQLNGNDNFQRDLLAKIAALGRRRQRGAPGPTPVAALRKPHAFALRTILPREPRILAIGSSTGGPQALLSLLKAVSPDVTVPIVIAQHMPATFTTVLAQHIERASGRPCREAVHGEAILSGRIYIAPGDFHFEVLRDGTALKAQLHKAPPQNFCRPSVNPLFHSVARAFGPQAVAVMLTGMGSDGLDGTRDFAAAGAAVIAQDEASSVIWGMPGAVANAGLCSAVLPLAGIAPHLTSLFARSRR